MCSEGPFDSFAHFLGGPELPGVMEEDPTGRTLEAVGKQWSDWLFLGGRRSKPDGKPAESAARGPGKTGAFPPARDHRPAVYEIGRLPGVDGDFQVVYVGRTTKPSQGVTTRLHDHLKTGDSIWPRVEESLEANDELHARFVQFDEDDHGREMARNLERQLWDALVSSGRYPWNVKRPSE
jgi:hypothetical protein